MKFFTSFKNLGNLIAENTNIVFTLRKTFNFGLLQQKKDLFSVAIFVKFFENLISDMNSELNF
jgi:hypothetical protein